MSSRGYGKYKRGASHSSYHFDSLFKENANKPSAARSAASVGKWGMTSFTSIRTLNGRPENDTSANVAEAAPKPKKFFKSRDTDSQASNNSSNYTSSSAYSPSPKKSRYSDPEKYGRTNTGSKKFFSSKNTTQAASTTAVAAQEKSIFNSSNLSSSNKRRNSDKSDSSESNKPPIVLRICRGKSEFVNDTDDTETTITPSSTPSTSTTSPRALRETPTNSQVAARPSNCRITRSARRSMQQDQGNSPAAADTPSEFSLFSISKKDILDKNLSPQYIPAEEYELKRKAFYDSILKPNSPTKQEEEEEENKTDVKSTRTDDIHSSGENISKSDTVQEDRSVEEALAKLHGEIDYKEETTTNEEKSDLFKDNDINLSDGSKNTMTETTDKILLPDQIGSCSESKPVTENRKQETLESLGETLETIENIAKEIALSTTSKEESLESDVAPVVSPLPRRELRSRTNLKDTSKIDSYDDFECDEKPVKRDYTRSRRKAKETKKQENKDESTSKRGEVKQKIDVKEVALIETASHDDVKETILDSKLQEETKAPNPSRDDSAGGGGVDAHSDSDSTNSTVPENEIKPQISLDETDKSIPHADPVPSENPPDPPPVKLLISKKKGSIFKSRSLVNDDSNKRRARYVHKWIDDKDGGKSGGETPARINSPEENTEEEFTFKGDPLIRVSKTEDEQDITSIKCAKSDKSYYMVVRNVKKAHQIQEIGEFQEFNDDVEYILDALQDNNPISTRCLSAITLATKCMEPPFRMHVRAHGIVTKFFKALHDATKDQSLGLCTATVMFVLSQDRLNMDLDTDCLELMLNLLESDVSYQQALDECGLSSVQLKKNKDKVQELCTEIQSHGHAVHLNLENITTGQLAMETLLSLTSKRAGEWFKEELRRLGGLEHIMKTICECCRQVSDYVVSWTDILLEKLKKVDRCLRVLENVTQNNEENQSYIIKYSNGIMIDTLVSLYKLCDVEIPLYPVTDIKDKISTGTIIREALLVTLKVLINLTHHYKQQSLGSKLIGSKTGIIETSLHLLLQVPNYIPEQKKFELGVLVLMLLINLIQDQEANQKLLIEAKAPSKQEKIYSREESAVEALIIQFYDWEACAKIAENNTNAILDGEKDSSGNTHNAQNKSNEEFIEETVAKLLQKAGTHMEYTFLASYIVMLVGFLIMGNATYQENIRQFLRGNNFNDMVELLKKYFNFMNLTVSTDASSTCAVKATQKVIKFLEECDKTNEPGNAEHSNNQSSYLPVDF